MSASRVVGHAVGKSVLRKEDRRLLTGRGRFIADLQLPGMVQVAFARSNLAHARIRAVDVSRAQALPGVLAVFIARDIDLDAVPGMQNRQPLSWRNAVEHTFSIPDTPLMATDKVRYVGEAYAIVVAESRLIADDAVELIATDFESLPVVVSIEDAMRSDAPIIHDGHTSNLVAQFRVRKGNAQSAEFRGLRRIRRAHRNALDLERSWRQRPGRRRRGGPTRGNHQCSVRCAAADWIRVEPKLRERGGNRRGDPARQEIGLALDSRYIRACCGPAGRFNPP